jgi:ABC-2 type transport system ATP-binding protein
VSESPLAELREVHKELGGRAALAGASFAVRRGEIVALLGPNGAGKTTAIRILLGLRRPDAGVVRLCGRDPTAAAARRSVGWTPQETDLPETLRVGELVDFTRLHYPHPAPRATVLERFGLDGLARRQAGGLSGGERRRVAVALAFAGEPELVVLDEPGSGLDRSSRGGLWAAIRRSASSGHAVLLATHDLAEAEALATRIVLLQRGRTAFDGTVAEIRRRLGGTVVRIAHQRLPRLENADSIDLLNGSLVLHTHAPDALVRELVGLGTDLRALQVVPVSLEQGLLGAERS